MSAFRLSICLISLKLHDSPIPHIQFIVELYGIYMAGTSQLSSIHPYICPSKTSNLKQVYEPNGQLSPTITLSCVAMIIGGIIRLLCYRSLGTMFRWEVSLQKSHKLITSGLYSIVRHPSYTGMLFVSLGYTGLSFAEETIMQECLFPSYGLWIQSVIWFMVFFRLSVVVWLSIRTIEEDRLLKKEFGVQWDQWAAKTKYRIIPYVL
jgi:protein-S-isoprenylcysteine O-methyltransferase Ste14